MGTDALGDMELATLSFQEANRVRPMVQFTNQAIDILSAPWRKALVVKLLGKHCNNTAMKEKLCRVWRFEGAMM